MRGFKCSKTKQRILISCFLSLLLFFSLSIPIQFVKAITSPSYWTSREYKICQVYNGSTEAGLKGHDYEYVHLPTSEWTEMVADLQSGNFMVRAELFNLPGTPLPLVVSLTYNSLNSAVDIGMGLGWISNLHACVDEDSSTHDLTYVTGTGAKLVFDWDSGNSVYLNPPGFAGKAEELQGGGYKITPLGSGSLTFNSDGKLTEIKERCGTGKQTVGYTDGRPTSLTDYLSTRAITLAWSEGGKLTEVTDPMSHEWGLTYDEGDDYLIELVKPGGTTVKALFEYTGPSNKMDSHTDFESNESTIAYYTSGTYTGWLNTWTQPSTAETNFAYDTAEGYSLKTTLTDGESHAVNYFFGSTSHFLEKVQLGASGPEVEIDYNAGGFSTSLKDAFDKETTYAYDAAYHVTSITYPPPTTNGVSFVQEFTYDAATVDGKITKSREKVANTNPVTWAVTDYAYTDNDAPYFPSSISNPLDEVTTIGYNAQGLVSSVTEPTVGRGAPPVTTKTTTYTYDATVKTLTRITDTDGNDTAFTYNSNGLASYVAEYEGDYDTGTLLHNTENTFDATSRITATEDSVTSQTTSATFNNNGATTGKTSSLGCQQTLTYSTAKPFKLIYYKPIDDNYPPVRPIIPGINPPPALLCFSPNPESSTDAQGHETTYTYRNDGTLHESTDYLSQVTDYSQDSYGRVDTITQPNGRTTTFSYDLDSRIITIASNSESNTTITYDDAGHMTQLVNPILGTVNYTYNVRGDKLTDEKGTYSYDLLRRRTGLSYTAGGSDSWSYDADQQVASYNSFAYEYDILGNPTRWQNDINDYATFTYTGGGSTALGLPSSTTGSSNLSSYAYTWNGTYWLYTLQTTGKTGSYNYGWSSSKELTSITYPNSANLSQTWTSKMLDAITVRNGQTDYLVTDSTFNANEQMTQYVNTVHEDGQDTFTETNDMTYDSLGRISQLAYDSTSQTIDYGYDTTTGQLESINFSDLGEYTISYSTSTGNISSVTYPNDGGSEAYTYNGSLGRLSQIAYPGNKDLNLTWNGKNQVTQVSYDDDGTVTNYALSYNGTGKLSGYTKSEGGIQTEVWDFHYGPFGLEKADRTSSPTITEDFTVDPNGRILSMTYTEAGGFYNGEYYFYYDNFGNTTLLTDSNGNRKYAALYDLNNGKILSEWNLNNLVLVNKGEGSVINFSISSDITISVFSKSIHLHDSVSNKNITQIYTTMTTSGTGSGTDIHVNGKNNCPDNCDPPPAGMSRCGCLAEQFDIACSFKLHWNTQCRHVNKDGFWYSPFVHCNPENGLGWCLALSENDPDILPEEKVKNKHQPVTEEDKKFIKERYDYWKQQTNYYKERLDQECDIQRSCNDYYPGECDKM